MKHGCDRSTCMEDLSRVCCLSDNIKASDRRASIATRGAFNRHLMKFEVLNVFFFLFCKCTENGYFSFRRALGCLPSWLKKETNNNSWIFLSVTTSCTLTKTIYSDTFPGMRRAAPRSDLTPARFNTFVCIYISLSKMICH